MSSPFPNLQIYPSSGLTFPWAFKEHSGGSSFDADLGPEGIGLGAQIIINWIDLNTACQQLLGYSYRDETGQRVLSGSITSVDVGPPMSIHVAGQHGLSSGDTVTIADVGGCNKANGTWIITVTSPDSFEIGGVGNGLYTGGGTWTCTIPGNIRLRRRFPWQHPFWNQLYVRKITKVQGMRQVGKQFFAFNLDGSPLGDLGPGYHPNYGPYTGYDFATLTLAFWRPPYYMRTDEGILDDNGNPQEWIRYVSKHWENDTQILSREHGAFVWSPGQGPGSGTTIPTNMSVGQVVSHERVTRRWFQIPEQCIFEIINDLGTPDGLPLNLIYTQTPTTNPVTGFVYMAGNPIKGCVNSPKGGGTDNFDQASGDDLRFFGCWMGTLRLDGIDIIEQPLHLPPYLMQIPALAGNEAISTQQFDVVFHFDLFDPPRSPQIQSVPPQPGGVPKSSFAYRGHNLLPWAGDGLWYMAQAPGTVGGMNVTTTAHQYADFYDLFKVL